MDIKELQAKLDEANARANAALAEAAKAQTLKAELEVARQENAKLQAQQLDKVHVKAGVNKDTNQLTGTVGVYGINSIYPVSLYPEGWEKLFKVVDEIRKHCLRPDVVAAAARSKALKKAERDAKRNGQA